MPHVVRRIIFAKTYWRQAMEQDKTKINFYITKKEYDAFKQNASNQEMSMSVILRNMVKESNKQYLNPTRI